MHAKITARQRQCLKRAIDIRIREYARCQGLLRHVDREVFATGMNSLGSESALALWLCEPARALNDKAPLRVLGTAQGCKRVANILRAISSGVYL